MGNLDTPDYTGSFFNGMNQAQQARGNAMNLSALALQQKKQAALEDAYSKNTNPDGTVNKQGVISALAGQRFGAEAQQAGSAIDEQQAQNAQRKYQLYQTQMNVVGPAMEGIGNLPPEQRPAAYAQLKKGLVGAGLVKPEDSPDQFDQNYYDSWMKQYKSSPMYTDRKLKESEIAKNYGEAGKVTRDEQKTGAEELGKFKDDLVNASSRKTTGALIDTRNRADRILTLVGRQKGESDQDYLNRVNQYMPQVGTEIGTSLAAIMQGGIPNEELQKKLAPDTMQSKLAELQQQFQAAPTGANQAKLLAAYGEVAQKLRDFSAGRLQDVTKRARAAYPYANKYYAKEMDQVAAPLEAPNAGAEDLASITGSKGKPSGAGNDGSAFAGQAPRPSVPKPGAEEGGYVFMGGNPADSKSWKRAK